VRAGCGKTTLLGILAGSVGSLSRSSRVSGRVTLDGQPRQPWAARMVAYVPQFDFLLPTLTVAETLRYSAQLRLPPRTRRAEVEVCPPSMW
jgi:ABC-type multidrug transport system ATPase subunit